MFVRFDNGPEFVAIVIARWCAEAGVAAVFIKGEHEAGSGEEGQTPMLHGSSPRPGIGSTVQCVSVSRAAVVPAGVRSRTFTARNGRWATPGPARRWALRGWWDHR